MSRRVFWVGYFILAFACGVVGALLREHFGGIACVGSILLTIFSLVMLSAPVTGSSADHFFENKFFAFLAIIVAWAPFFLL